ncbi:MAG: hypothetical protein RBS39_07020 [Phycisphaerales bacterium]|nr:hypothetical protein [Phycisphaerales bacterium]
MRGAPRRDAAFTVVDVLVTIVVIAILVGILLPSMASVRESTRRVLCGSGERQITIGLAMYANEQRGALPSSEYFYVPSTAGDSTGTRGQAVALSQLDTLRISKGRDARGNRVAVWDGLGKLYATEVLPASKLFYCPSQRGNRGFEAVASQWLSPYTELRGNFHMRPVGPSGERAWWQLEGRHVTVLSDSLSSKDTLNHEAGFNIARADTSVEWFLDQDNRIGGSLPSAAADGGGMDGNNAVWGAWNEFDSQ